MEKIDKAVIMAAGIGKRMQPVSFETPKPLIKVNGKRMIDTVVEALHKNGINEIYVVVGYKKECFYEWQKENKDIVLIENKYFDSCNNISSLFVAKEHLENAFILDGDQIIYNSEILSPFVEKSGYCGMFTSEETDEWLMNCERDENKNLIVKKCSRIGGKNGYQLFSVSRWNKNDGQKLKASLEKEFIENNQKDIYWDDVPMFLHFDDFSLGVYEIQKGDLIEIDNFDELVALDSSYKNY